MLVTIGRQCKGYFPALAGRGSVAPRGPAARLRTVPIPTTSDSTRSGSGALSHLRVADFSRVLAGPIATMVLADLGADVVKVEQPGVGDETNALCPQGVNKTRCVQ